VLVARSSVLTLMLLPRLTFANADARQPRRHFWDFIGNRVPRLDAKLLQEWTQ
jgi:hypothetical protein